jgi:hypothetical protein
MADNDASLLTGVSVFGGTGSAPVLDQAIVVEGRRISWMGPAADAPSFAAERTREVKEGTVHRDDQPPMPQ